MNSIGPYRGDLLLIDCGVFTHPAFYLGNGWVADNSATRGGSAVRPFTEAVGRREYTVQRLSNDPAVRSDIAHRAESLANARTYRFFDYNCEHFVSEVLGNEKRSPQLRAWATAAVLVGLIVIVSNAGVLRSAVRRI